MSSVQIIQAELGLVAKIVRDETWLEGERRGCKVNSRDPIVQQHVADVILSQGAAMREEVQA